MKICTNCGVEKPFNEFYFRKKDRRYISYCKDCQKRKSMEHRNKNKEYYKNYYEKNKEYFSDYQKQYYKNNKQILNTNAKHYYEEKKEHLKEYQKSYYIENKEKVKAYNSAYRKDKIKNDNVYRLKHNIATSLRNCFNNKHSGRSKKIKQITGLSCAELYDYLLQTFEKNYGKSWDGVEKVNIDHIIPLSDAKTIEDVYKLNKYTNLQLLTEFDNRKKWKYKNTLD